jgi:hypothetical protein
VKQGQECGVHRVRGQDGDPGMTKKPITLAKIVRFKNPFRFERMIGAEFKTAHFIRIDEDGSEILRMVLIQTSPRGGCFT